MRLFGGHRKGKDNQSIVKILWIGLVVLILNLLLNMLHIYDVQRRFRTVKIEEVYQNLKCAEMILETEYADAENNLNQIAQALANDASDLVSEEAVIRMLENCNASGRYMALYYITDEGISYSDLGERVQLSEEDLREHYQVERAQLRVVRDELTDDGYGILRYLQPVYVEGSKTGQLVAEESLETFFDDPVFDYLKDAGDLFLITGDGSIYLRETYLFMDLGERYTNLYDLLFDTCADNHSRKDINVLKRQSAEKNIEGGSRHEQLQASMIDMYGNRDYIEYRSVSGIPELYLVSIYPETVYTNVTKPLLFRTLLISSLLILITIVMVSYMWLSSKQSNDLIRKLAYQDPVTGGMNDNYFREIASRVIWDNNSIPYVVTRFDIANFRYINEAYGHVRADELLKIINDECARIFTGKEICVRMTADQFLLLARNDQDFNAKFEELLRVVNEQAKEIGIMFPIRLKRGIYPVRRDDTDIGIIIDHANAARKSLTGDEKVLVATYSEQIVTQMFLNDKIESEMEQAMKTEEFKVFIQAKWDIKNDHVHGGEALVRWIKPDGSRIFPDQFIPVFEKNGFVEKLDMYMLEQVCKHQRELIDEGREIFPISVNQSRLLMHNPDYLPQVERLMKKYRIPNGYVEIEITETVFQDERALMIHTANELKKMEIQLDMDDFGSGYSSLNMLKDVPFDVIKIDREFFSESITSKASVWILQKIIEMAEGLGIRTLCEGVENEEQVSLLRELGCYYVQGYYYAKPMPFAEYMDAYCHEKEGGREYYDKLYEEQTAVREERKRKEEEEKNYSAQNAVEEFKRTYTPQAEEKPKEKKEEDGKKKISSEELKLQYLQDAGEKRKDRDKEPQKGADGADKAEEMSVADAVKQAQETASAVTNAKSAAEAVKALAAAQQAAKEAAEARKRQKAAEEGGKVMSADEAVRLMKEKAGKSAQKDGAQEAGKEQNETKEQDG